MGKLVIKHLGKVIGETNLRLGRMTIGRRAGDIPLDDPAVSSMHAQIETVAGGQATIYDLNSTNGTFVDGKRVKTHELIDKQTIVIGEHALLYLDEIGPPVTLPKPASASRPVGASTAIIQFAHLRVIEGGEKGKRVSLSPENVTVDIPGKKPLRVTRLTDRYLLESDEPNQVKLNDHPMPPEGSVLLEDGDVIELGGTKFKFDLK
ncbi:MAG: FHA domain-containing protein [Sulfurifustis sp.]